MAEAGASDVVRFYFSFRSPYAWFALHRIDSALAGLPVRVRLIPVYPPDDMQNDPARVPNKLDYIFSQDVVRIARAYGLPLGFARGIEPDDWSRPHAAFLWAEAQGEGEAFAREAFAARFARGLNLGHDDVIGGVARACGLDGEGASKAARDPDLQARARAARDRGFEQEGLFGVPTFVYRGESFWGNDRLEWLVRAIQQSQGRDVPDLSRDPMASPQRISS